MAVVVLRRTANDEAGEDSKKPTTVKYLKLESYKNYYSGIMKATRSH